MRNGRTRSRAGRGIGGFSAALWMVVALAAAGCAATGPAMYRPLAYPAGERPAERDGSPRALIDRLLAPPAWSPGAVSSAPRFHAGALETAIHEAVNAVRTAHDLPPLAWAASLADVARGHSDDMAGRAFFGHVNPGGEDATARARRAGIDPSGRVGNLLVAGVGENLFLTHRYHEYRTYPAGRGGVRYEFDWKSAEDVAQGAVEAWLASRAHRANLLSPVYGAHGIGVVLGENQTVYVTQNFAGRDGGTW